MSSFEEEIARKFGGGNFQKPVDPNMPVPVPESQEQVVVLPPDPLAGGSLVSVNDMLVAMVELGGSDLFLSAGSRPTITLRGSMTPLEEFPELGGGDIKEAIFDILDDRRRKMFEETKELDTSHHIKGVSRFRLNVFNSKGSVSAVFRAIPEKIMSLDDLKMPKTINEFCDLPRGLVLVTGPTGSGKSTTLAAMIDQINRTKQGHILTIEDPIEFVHQHKRCLVNQREVGTDTDSFENALKAALREAPNYVLVGEMRDLETISMAISIAETGHLVFGTLHTQSTKDTISRIVDVFPAQQQEQIRVQLSSTLQAVVCQNLVKTADGKGRVAAVEIMKITDGIKTMIKQNKLDQIVSELQIGKGGMQTMDGHLEELVRKGLIHVDAALGKAYRREDLVETLGGEEGVEKYRRMIPGGSSGAASPMGGAGRGGFLRR